MTEQQKHAAALFVLRTLTSRMSIMSPDRQKALDLAIEYDISVEFLFQVALERSLKV